MHSAPEPAQVAAILERLPMRGGMPKVTSFEMDSEYSLITEVGTFEPFEFRTQRHIRLTLQGSGKGEEKSQRTFAYSYPDS